MSVPVGSAKVSEKWDRRYLAMARHVATWSKDPSTQCGAVLVMRHAIIPGFNGFPEGMPDRPEWYLDREEKYSRIIHAEMNALLHARHLDLTGASLYSWPLMSCDRCAVLLLQAGVRRFVAPPLGLELQGRWNDSLCRTKLYIAEVGGEFLELKGDE